MGSFEIRARSTDINRIMLHTKIAFRQVGEGPVLILIHGYAGSVLHWDHIVQKMKSQYQIVTPNLTHLYMGQVPFTFTEQIEIFADFIRKNFPNQKVHLAGISYGGALVWGMTLKYPELIEKTVFINPMPPAPVQSFSMPILKGFFRLPFNSQALFLVLKTPIGRLFLKRAAQVFRIDRADLWDHSNRLNDRKLKFVSHVINSFSVMLKKENWNAWKMRLESWTHMSMLIYDFEDPLFEPKTYHRFQDLIGCEFTREVHNAGHIAIQTRSDEIAEMMSEFLDVKRSATAA